jgi:hypothetical protein
MTHLIDGDQRTVELRVLERQERDVIVQAPPDSAVAPAGPYMLFANRPTGTGLVPSVAWQLFVDAPVPAGLSQVPAAGVAGTPAPPFEPPSPAEVLAENLQDALGLDD